MGRRHRYVRGAGFTLVELLVVIAIIGVLVALLLPAIQAAREAARRAQCINNLKQLGISCQLHIDAHGFLPSAGWGDWWVGCPDRGAGRDQPGNWTYQLLPFIEESARSGLGSGFKCGDPAARPAITQMMATPVSTFYCPSRRPPDAYPWTNTGSFNFTPPPLAAKSDYAANLGDVLASCETDIGPRTLEEAATYVWRLSGTAFVRKAEMQGSFSPTGHTGVIYQRSETELREITDGTSNTYLIGEKNLNPDAYLTGLTGNDDQSMYNGCDRDNMRSTHAWLRGWEGRGPARWMPQPDTPGADFSWSFGGPHTAGWAVVMCDGSVQFVTFDIDPIIHQRLGNRLDGEVVNLSDL